MQNYQIHDVANVFPVMSDDEYASLLDDIKKNGLREKIWLYQDKIIDGRNRYRACLEAGVEPKFREWDGVGSLVGFVVSLNLTRRHLTSGQRAACYPDLEAMIGNELAEEARKRQSEAGKNFGTSHPKELTQTFAEAPKNRNDNQASAQAAAILGTNRKYVNDIKGIGESAPEIIEKIKQGVISVENAIGVSKLTETERSTVFSKIDSGAKPKVAIREAKRETQAKEFNDNPIPTGKYRVFYADPPWKYDNSGTITEGDSYGRAERHYPTMSIEELCDVPVKDISDDDAVLFMWVTSPFLEDAFRVIGAWGFKYKSSFVWDKIKHNFAHYNSMRHEFLLVCTKGSCTPDNKKLYDSVVSIERSDTHSEKPEEFRRIIDDLYTFGNKIELFSRTKIDGWHSFGNQAK